MKLSFAKRIKWDEGIAKIPPLTPLEIGEVLKEYRPTPENRICYCQGSDVCAYCMLTQIIDQQERTLLMVLQESAQKRLAAFQKLQLEYWQTKAQPRREAKKNARKDRGGGRKTHGTSRP